MDAEASTAAHPDLDENTAQIITALECATDRIVAALTATNETLTRLIDRIEDGQEKSERLLTDILGTMALVPSEPLSTATS